MSITPEQAEVIKKQLISQIENSQQENKEQIISYLKELNEEELEEFLKQNNIQVPSSDSTESEKSTQCIFCAILKNQVPSYKIAEDSKSLAILEINPLSKGHSIIIPKEHTTIDKLHKSSLSLAQKIAKKIKKKLKPEDIKIETSSFQGHAMINIIPIYKEQLKKYKASEPELKLIQNKLATKTRAKRTPKEKESSPSSKEKTSEKPKRNLPEIPPFRIP